MWALARIRNVSEIDEMIGIPRVIMLEMDRAYDDANEDAVAALVRDVVHPAGLRALTSSDKRVATVRNHAAVFEQGFDVVLSYNVPNGVEATRAENQRRGVTP